MRATDELTSSILSSSDPNELVDSGFFFFF